MKLTYAVTFDDFKSLQAPFPVRAGNNVGFKAVLIACGLMGLLGVYVILEGMGLPVGLFLIGLGIVAGMAASLYEKRSVRANQKKYEDKLERAFQQVHCRDERVLATDDAGFTVSCKCGTVTRPWSEVNSFSENETVFTIITKMGGQSYPKSAFSSQAQITEFRALVSGKLAQDKPATAPHFAYALKPEDYRAAYWLHTLKGGGWRGLAKALATYACILYGTFVIWNSIAANNVPVRAGLVGALVGLPLLAMMKKRRKEFFGQVRVYFSDEGLHMQYPSAQLRKPWSQFIGYLENDKIVLLYLSPKLYNTIPKRALTGPAARFRAMAEAKLAPYDYRNLAPKLNSSPQEAS